MTREDRKEAIKVIKNYDLNNPKVNSLLFSAEEIANPFDCALEALEQEPCPTCKYGVLGKITNFFQNWDCDENAKLEISVRDMREICSMFVTKCRAESKLKALQKPCEDAISRDDAIKCLVHGLTDADMYKYAVQVQNGEGYYNSDGKYVSYDLD